MKNYLKFKIYVGVWASMLSLNANAYIDPGTTGLVIQGLVAAVGILLVFFKRPLEFIKKLFKKNDR